MELLESIRRWELWCSLGWKDVKRRYRRTLLGPFWLTLSMALLIATLGFLYAELFRVDPRIMIPYVSAGVIGWSFISTLASDGCVAFTQVEATIRQLRFPYLICVFRVVWRNIIIFLHHVLIQVIVVAIFAVPVGWTLVLLIPGLALVLANATWFIILIGLLCTRYRDITQLVTNLLTIMMFVTPVFWLPEQAAALKPIFVDYNIFHHLLELMRQPLLGGAPSSFSYLLAATTALAGWLVTAAVYQRYYRLIPFWL